MDQALKERLEILKMAGMLQEPMEATLHRISEKLKEDGIEPTDEKIGMFLTHLVAALNRSGGEEAIVEANEELLQELRENEHYPKAQEYFEEIQKTSNIHLHAGEEAYIGGYLCVLLADRKEGKE